MIVNAFRCSNLEALIEALCLSEDPVPAGISLLQTRFRCRLDARQYRDVSRLPPVSFYRYIGKRRDSTREKMSARS